MRARSAFTIVAAFAVAACSNDPALSLPDARSLIDAPALVDARPLGCASPTGAGTHEGSVNTAATWTAADSPHDITFDINVYAPLTIEACAVVRIGAGVTVTVVAGSSLTAIGASGRPVTFERLDAGSAWATIRSQDGDISLTHVIVNGGGAPLNTLPAYTAAIRLQSDTGGSLHVDDVEIADSESQGVYINGTIGFDETSQDLRVHGSVGFPVHVYARVIGTIPSGEYTGNGRDEIGIAGSGGAVLDNQTMHDRGVPYHVGSGQDGGRMDVSAQSGVAVLTIEPGVTVRFPPGGTLNIEEFSSTDPATGALVAIGTADKPITFTSDQTPGAAGDWLGIGLGGFVDPATTLDNVIVAFAGGPGTGSNSCPYPLRTGQNDAAIRIFGTAGPLTQFITNTQIVKSLRDGIDRGWRDDVFTDFLDTNSFDVGVGGCKESVPRTFNGVCPESPACP